MSREFLKKHKYSIFIILFFLFLLPTSMGLPAQTDTRAIVTGISIDKEENGYNVALQLITPQSNISNNENLDIVEDNGETFYESLHNLSIKLGKVIGLEHTNVIILGNSLKDDDIMNILDYMYRNSKITLSTIILQAGDNAKKLLETSAELNNNSSSSLQNNLGYNEYIVNTSNSISLGKFYNDYFTYPNISIIPVIEQPENEGENSQANQQSSNSQASSSSSVQSGASSSESKVEPLIINNSESVIYKDGKFITKISKELTKGFSWILNNNVKGIVKVENVKDNSTVIAQIEQSNIKIKPVIKDNKLIFKTTLKLYSTISEIKNNNNKSQKILETDETYLTKALTDKLKEKVKSTINDSLNFCKENNLDVFKFYDKFYKFNKKGLRRILNIYGNDYLKACEFELDIQIYPYK